MPMGTRTVPETFIGFFTLNPIDLSTRYIIQSNDVIRVRQQQVNDVAKVRHEQVNDVILGKVYCHKMTEQHLKIQTKYASEYFSVQL